jgi:hypothetical protein
LPVEAGSNGAWTKRIKVGALGIFFLTHYSPFIVYLTHSKASSYHFILCTQRHGKMLIF